MRRLHVLGAVLAIVVLDACIRVEPQTLGRVPDSPRDTLSKPGVGVVGGGSLVDNRPDSRWSEKRIDRKVPPQTLVSQDNDQCDVAPMDFAMANVGHLYGCNWRGTPKPVR